MRGATVGPGDGHAHGSGNPHYWLDPKNAEIITGNILEGLARIDPANGPRLRGQPPRVPRSASTTSSRSGRRRPRRCSGVPLVAYHNSWAYFARRFRLDFVGFVEPKPGVPPSPSHIASLISLMQKRKVRIIVRQPHEPERDVAFLAQAHRQHGGGARRRRSARCRRADDYLSLFDANIAALHRAAAKPAMTAALELLWPPFLVAFCLVGIHAYFGIQVLTRNVVFVDLALAQIAALGATVAFMLGHPALGIDDLRLFARLHPARGAAARVHPAWSARIPQEALIGVIYVVAAAAAILLIDRAPQGAEHLKQILTGNILLTGTETLVVIVPLYAAIGVAALAAAARVSRRPARFAWEFVFYATFGVVVTSSVALAGVLLVFSFLIIPAAIGVLYADTHRRASSRSAGSRARSPARSASRPRSLLDLPTGAAMVCMFGASLALAGAALSVPARRRGAARAGAPSLALRWGVAALLAGSALLLMLAPRADQPLLDAAEYAAAAVAHALFHRRRGGDLRGCAPLRRALPHGGRAPERDRDQEPRAGRGDCPTTSVAAHVVVPQILRRDAARRGVRHARGALARPRADALDPGPLMLVLGFLIAPGAVGFLRRKLASRAPISP